MPYKDRATQLAYFRQHNRLPSEIARRKRDRHLWDSAKHANEKAMRYRCVGRLKAADVRLVFERDGGVCVYCGGLSRLGLDHVWPLHLCGPNILSNIVLCCGSCNGRKQLKRSVTAWSSKSDCCIACGTTERRHCAKGLCGRCYQRQNAVAS